MKKIKFYAGTMFVGSEVTKMVEVDDDLTEDEIYEIFNKWLDENIDAGWYLVDEDEEEE